MPSRRLKRVSPSGLSVNGAFAASPFIGATVIALGAGSGSLLLFRLFGARFSGADHWICELADLRSSGSATRGTNHLGSHHFVAHHFDRFGSSFVFGSLLRHFRSV